MLLQLQLLIILSVASVSGFQLNGENKRSWVDVKRTVEGLDITSRRHHLSLIASSILGLSSAFIHKNSQLAHALSTGGKPVLGDESIMAPKEHGSSSAPVQKDLLFGVSNNLADRICNYNRHFAEMSGYFTSTTFTDALLSAKGQPLTFYDSVTGKPLFVAPINRSVDDFLRESEVHGWPSFRDSEVVWDNVRILKSGETVSVDGTHLGHNLPDKKGNRYCINLVSIAGQPIMS